MPRNRQLSFEREEVSPLSTVRKGQMIQCATLQHSRKPVGSLLVIAANAEDRVTVSDALQANAYEIVFCDSLDTRDTRLLDDRSFDACIIELNYPVETCFELLSTIKRKCPLAEVIILSRLADEELWIESIQRGAYDFLPRPLDRKELQRIVANAVAKNRHGH
jgi:DNA-binding NtrC family response regulator